MVGLLDVNILIALLDPAHLRWMAAQTWMANNYHHKWATCAITQLGLVRVLSQPSYKNSVTTGQAFALLSELVQSPGHQYWADLPSPVDTALLDSRAVITPSQLTDSYLLALAVAGGGRLVTFDRKIRIETVPGATPANLVVL